MDAACDPPQALVAPPCPEPRRASWRRFSVRQPKRKFAGKMPALPERRLSSVILSGVARDFGVPAMFAGA